MMHYYMCHQWYFGWRVLKIYIIVLMLHLTHQQEFDAQFTTAVCKINLLTLCLFLLEGKNAGEDGQLDTSYQINLKIFRYFLDTFGFPPQPLSLMVLNSSFATCLEPSINIQWIHFRTNPLWTHSWCPNNFAPCSYSPTWKGLLPPKNQLKMTG